MTDARSTWSSGFAAAREDAASVYEETLVSSLFTPWAAVLLDAVKILPGDHVLDVATGPGSVARPAALRAGPIGKVVACDISPAMLEAARRTPVQSGAAPITWVESPAAPLAVVDGDFDVVTCQHGLQFFPDRPAALAEMHRALRPRGRLGVAVWAHQSASPGFAALGSALRAVLGDDVADRYAGGPWGLPEAADVAALIEAAGFTGVAVSVERQPVVFPGGPAQLIRSLAVTPVATDVAALASEQRAVFIETAERLLAPMTTDGVVRFEMVAHIGVATKDLDAR